MVDVVVVGNQLGDAWRRLDLVVVQIASSQGGWRGCGIPFFDAGAGVNAAFVNRLGNGGEVLQAVAA